MWCFLGAIDFDRTGLLQGSRREFGVVVVVRFESFDVGCVEWLGNGFFGIYGISKGNNSRRPMMHD